MQICYYIITFSSTGQKEMKIISYAAKKTPATDEPPHSIKSDPLRRMWRNSECKCMLKSVLIRSWAGRGGCVERVWTGAVGASCLWKINFKKPVLPLLRPELQPLHFNVRCSLHYLWCFTPQNQPALLHLIPIVTPTGSPPAHRPSTRVGTGQDSKGDVLQEAAN